MKRIRNRSDKRLVLKSGRTFVHCGQKDSHWQLLFIFLLKFLFFHEQVHDKRMAKCVLLCSGGREEEKTHKNRTRPHRESGRIKEHWHPRA